MPEYTLIGLTDDELDSVAGGGSVTNSGNNSSNTLNATANDNSFNFAAGSSVSNSFNV